jgi:hypothetical protein
MDAAKTSAETAKRASALETKLQAALERSRVLEQNAATAD